MNGQINLFQDTEGAVSWLIDHQKELTERNLEQLKVWEANHMNRPEVINTIKRCIKRKGFSKVKEAKA